MWTSTFFHIFFNQANALRRLALLRISVGVVVAVLLGFGIDAEFVGQLAMIFDADNVPAPIRVMLPHLDLFRLFGVGAAILYAIGIALRISGAVLIVSLGTIGYVDASLAPGPWAFHTHLLFFTAFLMFTRCDKHYAIRGARHPATSDETRQASAALSAMQLYIAVVYFQTGLSKLYHSGVDWFTSGDTAQFFMERIGTPLGREMAEYPEVAIAGSILTGVFELIFLFLFLFFYRATFVLIITAILFHLAMLATLGIAFWHLWALFPALFLLKRKPDLRQIDNCQPA
ncbi:MAG: HTTM domain-containing protein [Pseudomonadota bacterium]